MYYVDYNKKMYLTIEDYYKNKSVKIVPNKDLLKAKRLLILKNRKIVYETNNVQALYLYPLNVLDYVTYAYMKKTLMYNILDIENCEYQKLINEDIKNVEIIIDNKALSNIDKIISLSQILKNNNKYVSYNLKTLDIETKHFSKICTLGDYFKVTLYNILGSDKYTIFLNQILKIKKETKNTSLIHIKGYLNIEQAKYYGKLIKDLKDNVDIIQISKELIPLTTKYNPKVEDTIQEMIRNLEKENEKFISVKDISSLYYQRFELDERNSHKCYTWFLKPYIQGNNVLPCKVNQVVNNIDEWKVKDLSKEITENIKKYGIKCTDCASIFENDILSEIINFYNKGYEFLLEIEEK